MSYGCTWLQERMGNVGLAGLVSTTQEKAELCYLGRRAEWAEGRPLVVLPF